MMTMQNNDDDDASGAARATAIWVARFHYISCIMVVSTYCTMYNPIQTFSQNTIAGGENRIWHGNLLDINYCCGIFTDYISARAHYSRLHSTLVPSVACQTTEGEYLLLTIPTTYQYLVVTLQVYTNIK